MTLKNLKETAPWNWPSGTDELLLSVLNDPAVGEADRVLAAELASDLVVINAQLVGKLLALVGDPAETEALRSQAAISLGPVLELCSIDGFEDPTEVPIQEATFLRMQEQLAALFRDGTVPTEVRRRILESSARAEQAWHHDAIRQAFLSQDPNWQLTAVFCMGYIGGFDIEILKALDHPKPAIQYLAISAAGVWQVQQAWPKILENLLARASEKPIVLAAINALANLRPKEAEEVLAAFLQDEDDDIAEAAGEAIGLAEERLKTQIDDEDEPQSGENTLN